MKKRLITLGWALLTGLVIDFAGMIILFGVGP